MLDFRLRYTCVNQSQNIWSNPDLTVAPSGSNICRLVELNTPTGWTAS